MKRNNMYARGLIFIVRQYIRIGVHIKSEYCPSFDRAWEAIQELSEDLYDGYSQGNRTHICQKLDIESDLSEKYNEEIIASRCGNDLITIEVAKLRK